MFKYRPQRKCVAGWEEGGDDARSACPSDALGCTHNTMATTAGCDGVILSQSFKSRPSSDWGLQLDPMKPESLVIAGQLYRGEYVPKSCTRVAVRLYMPVRESRTMMRHCVMKRNRSSDAARSRNEG